MIGETPQLFWPYIITLTKTFKRVGTQRAISGSVKLIKVMYIY